MNVRKAYRSSDENRFDRFFRCLLGIKTEILKIDAREANVRLSPRQITSGPTQPLVRIIRWSWCRRHTPGVLLPRLDG